MLVLLVHCVYLCDSVCVSLLYTNVFTPLFYLLQHETEGEWAREQVVSRTLF